MKVFETDSLFPPALGVQVASLRLSGLVILIVMTAVLAMLGLDWVVGSTRAGRGMRAVAENRDVASLMGVDLSLIVAFTFLLGSAGVGGVLIGLYYTQIDFLLGWFAGLKAFTAAVLGGIGNLRGFCCPARSTPANWRPWLSRRSSTSAGCSASSCTTTGDPPAGDPAASRRLRRRLDHA
jgi:branched-subunit amino acid ABC-type transport system permease component